MNSSVLLKSYLIVLVFFFHFTKILLDSAISILVFLYIFKSQ